MEGRTFVVKIRGTEPEGFVFITLNADLSGVARISYPALNEKDLWAALHKNGIPDGDIESLIYNARNRPL